MSTPGPSRKVSILLVDDKPARLLSYEEILRDLGHELVRAASGSEALEQLLRGEFALILLDVSMPGMDGFELAELVHEHPRFEKTPIIFVTGLAVSELDRLRGYELGAVDYVHVPIVPEILRSKVAVLTELYLKRKELQDLNLSLEQANADLFAANVSLQAEKARELEAANTELAEANRTLQGEIEERRRLEAGLVEADRRKDEFLAMLAHELRNPLAPIVNGVRFMMRRELRDPELVWSRDMIARQAEHLSRLVEDLLDVSRISQGKIRLRKTRVALDAVVARAIETNRHLLEARGQQLALDLPPAPLHVLGDPTRLQQVVGNLLDNAAKFTPEGGAIRVALESAPGPGGAEEVLVRVRDTGPGIAPGMQARIFDLFSQVDPPSGTAQHGLGIGLALVRRLVELHGGRVEVHSPLPQGGSEFVVALPLLAVAPGEPAPETGDLLAGPAGSAPPARVLVVDDNRDSARSMGLLLRELGHEVQLCFDGAEGLRLAAAFEPALVFLDIGMPGLDGYEVARRMRELPRGPSITLVALTGYGQPADRLRTRAAGFDQHLVKPVASSDLDLILGEPRAAGPAAFEAQAGAQTPLADAALRGLEPRSLAHDIRTPLNSLCAATSLLLETALDPKQREYVGLLRSSAEALRLLADELAGDGAAAPAIEVCAPGAPDPGRRLDVLVVDDDPVNRAAMQHMLERLGHAAAQAADGREALSAVEAGSFDVVLLDLHLPGASGPEVAREIRRSQGGGRCPRMLGVTGSVLAEERAECLAAGMDAVLLKPVGLETLRSALETAELLDARIVASLSSQETSPGHSTFDKLLDLYSADTPEQIARVREAAERGDGDELAQAAHRLKGSSSLIGARVLVALASELESAARAGNLVGAAAIVADLEQAWTATRSALESASTSPRRAAPAYFASS